MAGVIMTRLILSARCIPSWLAASREDAMHIDGKFIHCVGFIGFPSSYGFRADGTCFALSIDEENERFGYLVTARHLVRPMKFRKETYSQDDEIFVRLPNRDGSAQIIKMTRGQWVPHHDQSVDICISDFDAIAHPGMTINFADEGGNSIVRSDFDFNTGISIVLSIRLALEVIYSKEVASSRALTINAIKKQSGFRHT